MSPLMKIFFVLSSSLSMIDASSVISTLMNVQLNNVASEMSTEVQAIYESTMTGFFQNNLEGVMENITVVVTSQQFGGSATRRALRRQLQTTGPLDTTLSVSGITTSATMTEIEFNTNIVALSNSQDGTIVYLLSRASQEPFFADVTSVVISSDIAGPEVVAPVPVPVPEPVVVVPAPVAVAPVPAPVKAPVAPPVMIPGPFFNNPMGVKVAISIATLWVISVTLGVGILLLYPEEKVPENWKSVTSYKK
jgi:hypothetical protein